MNDPDLIELPADLAFTRENLRRNIEREPNPEALRRIAMVLLEGYFGQRAATLWALRQPAMTDRPLDG